MFLFVSEISAYLLEAVKMVTFETYYCHKQTSLCSEERFTAEICMTDVERQTSGFDFCLRVHKAVQDY